MKQGWKHVDNKNGVMCTYFNGFPYILIHILLFGLR